jgi:hypothetical protein
MNCGDCKFFKGGGLPRSDEGECRRHPPKLYFELIESINIPDYHKTLDWIEGHKFDFTHYPHVWADISWCGDFMPKDDGK